MELFILNRNFNFVRLIDVYRSIIWTERWLEAGDFQIRLPLTNDLLDGDFAIKTEYFITTSDTDTVMIIEKIEIKEDLESASELILSGRSLECLLDRRIVWKYKLWRMQNPADIMYDVVRCSCAGEPTRYTYKERESEVSDDRKIPFFEIDESNRDEIANYVASKKIPKISQSFDGDNVYSIITDFAKKYNVGFKIFYKETDDIPRLIFKFVKGENRSSSQPELQNGGFKNPIVDLSDRFDNCNSTDYTKDKSKYKNINLVSGQGSVMSKTYSVKTETAFGESIQGFDRREVSSKTDDEKLITDETKDMYLEEGINLLKARYEEISDIISMKPGTKYVEFLDFIANRRPASDIDYSLENSKDMDPYKLIDESLIGASRKRGPIMAVSEWGFLTNKTGEKTKVLRPTPDIKEIKVNGDNAGEDKSTFADRVGLKIIKKESNDYWDEDKKHQDGQRKSSTYDLAAPDTVAKEGPWNVYFYSERFNKYIWAGGTVTKPQVTAYNKVDSYIKEGINQRFINEFTYEKELLNPTAAIFSNGIGRFYDLWNNSMWGDGFGHKNEHSFLDDYTLEEHEDFDSMMKEASRSAMSPFKIHLVKNGEDSIDAYVFENPDCAEGNYGINELPYKGVHEIMCYYMPVRVLDMPPGAHRTKIYNDDEQTTFETYDEKYDTEYDEVSFSRYMYFKYTPPHSFPDNYEYTYPGLEGSESIKAVNDLWLYYEGMGLTNKIKVYHPTYAQGYRWHEATRNQIKSSRFPFPNKNILIYLGSMDNIMYGSLQEKAARKVGENTIEESFSADIETHGTFKLNNDYYLGDTVNITNDYGENSEISELALVTEVTWSYEQGGNHVVPTLSLISEY